MDLMEAEDIKKRWQEYREELYKKDLNDPDNHNGVITHLEPDILECEATWALGSITTNKASGGDRMPNELFPILKKTMLLVHTISVLYCAHLCMKCSLGISNFLEEVSSLSHSIFLYFFTLFTYICYSIPLIFFRNLTHLFNEPI